MESVKKILQGAVELAFESAGYEKELGKVTISNRPDLCDYQSNGALIGAKKYQKNPIELAEDVQKYLEGDKALSVPLFSKVEVVKPGFLNMTLSPAFLAKYCSLRAEDEKNGLDPKEGKKVLDLIFVVAKMSNAICCKTADDSWQKGTSSMLAPEEKERNHKPNRSNRSKTRNLC